VVSRSISPHWQAVGSFGKNLSLYSPMGACLKIVLDALAHRVTISASSSHGGQVAVNQSEFDVK